MLRAKKPRAAFLFLPFVFCIYLSGVSVADDSCFQGLSTIPGNVKYFFEWDPTNPDEVNPNSNVEIRVIGGKSPYIWAVSGNGFTLSSSQSVSNTLTASNNACGTAEISVTDILGLVVTGHLRCTNGRWVKKNSNICIMKGVGTLVGSGSYYRDTELIVGYKKQTQRTRYNGGGSGFVEEQDAWDACDTYFSNYCEGNLGCISCENCIDPEAEPGQDWEMPCRVWWDPLNKWIYTHRCLLNFEFTSYYEWECQ